MSCQVCSEAEFWAQRKELLTIAHNYLTKETKWHEDIAITPLDVEVIARFIAGDNSS